MGAPGAWAYVVERAGAGAGALVGSTADAALYDRVGAARLNANASAVIADAYDEFFWHSNQILC